MTYAFGVKVIQSDSLLVWLCEEVLKTELDTENSELEMVKKNCNGWTTKSELSIFVITINRCQAHFVNMTSACF